MGFQLPTSLNWWVDPGFLVAINSYDLRCLLLSSGSFLEVDRFVYRFERCGSTFYEIRGKWKLWFQVDFDGFWDALPQGGCHVCPPGWHVSQYGVWWMFFGFKVFDLHSVKLTLRIIDSRNLNAQVIPPRGPTPQEEGWSNIQDIGQK